MTSDAFRSLGLPADFGEPVDPTRCPKCNAQVLVGIKFCEACGHDLSVMPRPACVVCGERDVADHGYCESCGYKQPAERDHQEFTTSTVVAVTDRGKRHRHNEDSIAIGGDDTVAVLVVSDGVSSTQGSDEVSLNAAIAARAVLVDSIVADTTSDEVVSALNAAACDAQAAAVEAFDQDQPTPKGGPPSATLVMAVAQQQQDQVVLTVGWIGDSRAYWLAEQPQLLTVDHEVSGGLTRWLGADAHDVVPDIACMATKTSGALVVCSDGLWRYAPTPGDMNTAFVALYGAGHRGLDLANGLVDLALDNGGHDNISVGVWVAGGGVWLNKTSPEEE